MKLSHYVYLWFFLTAYMAFEYWAINHSSNLSLLRHFQPHINYLKGSTLTTEPGRPLSWVLGWAGIILILLTNLYIFRKYFALLRGLGSLSSWLNFHIFCGLFGPSCVIFHSDFKVRGLVGISFWSMIIVAVSGVVGRYIYVQILRQEKNSTTRIILWSKRLDELRNRSKKPISDDEFDDLKWGARQFVGIPDEITSETSHDLDLGLFLVLVGSMLGDFKLLYTSPPVIAGMPSGSTHALVQYAISERQAIFLEPFRRMLGYWHAFHLPFALFMYIAAFIHIVAALMFGTTA